MCIGRQTKSSISNYIIHKISIHQEIFPPILTLTLRFEGQFILKYPKGLGWIHEIEIMIGSLIKDGNQYISFWFTYFSFIWKIGFICIIQRVFINSYTFCGSIKNWILKICKERWISWNFTLLMQSLLIIYKWYSILE